MDPRTQAIIDALNDDGLPRADVDALREILGNLATIGASMERDGQLLDCSQPEVTASAWGRVFAADTAAALAADMQDEVGDVNVDPSTHYHTTAY